MLVLLLFSLLVFCPSMLLSSWLFPLLLLSGLIFASAISRLEMHFICLWFVRSMLFSRVIPLLMLSTLRVLLSGVSLTLFVHLCVPPVPAAWLCALIWSFSASLSFYRGSARSLSRVVPSWWHVAVFRSLRYWLSFVLRRLVFVVLVCLRFPLFLLLVVLLFRRAL
jgi:hypothetical protein